MLFLRGIHNFYKKSKNRFEKILSNGVTEANSPLLDLKTIE
jgi:hypothetical protein